MAGYFVLDVSEEALDGLQFCPKLVPVGAGTMRSMTGAGHRRIRKRLSLGGAFGGLLVGTKIYVVSIDAALTRRFVITFDFALAARVARSSLASLAFPAQDLIDLGRRNVILVSIGLMPSVHCCKV